MYLSAHPLDEYEFEMNYVCNTTTSDLKNLEPLQGKALRIGGMVTAVRNGTSKAGKPYGVFTLEDYAGAFEFVLFGPNYVDFGKYMIKDLYLFIHAQVIEKGSDYRNYQQAPDPDKPKEYMLKITKIDMLSDVRNNLIDKLNISFSLQELNEDFVYEISDLIKSNKGNINVFFNVTDTFTNHKVNLFSRQYRVKIDKQLYRLLQKAKDEGTIEYNIGLKM